MDKIENMDTRSMISIIVPVYNMQSYLKRCINSIINQTYKNMQIIIIDDGSTDESGKICDYFSTMDNRVSVLHGYHRGTSAARNIGLRYAVGEFIGFVDSDDYIASDMYETMLCYMDNETDVTCCGRRCIMNKEKNYNAYCLGTVHKFSTQEAIEELLLHRNISFSVCTKLFRKKLFQNISFPVGKNCEDLPVTYSLLKNSRNICHIGTAKYYNFYREHSRSSHHDDTRWMDYVIFVRDILIDVKEQFPNLEKQAEARYLLNAMITLYGISQNENNYAKEKSRLEKMLRNMFFRAMINPYIQNAQKKLLLKFIILRKTDWIIN